MGDQLERGDELAYVGDPVFEQVSDAGGGALDERERVFDLDILREDDRRHVRVCAADLLGGEQALVRVGGRHADVDDGDVRRVSCDEPQKLRGGAGLRGHLDVVLGE